MEKLQEHFYANLSEKTRKELLAAKEGFIVGRDNDQLMRLDNSGEPLYTIAYWPEVRETHAAIPNLLTHEGSVLSVSIGARTIRETISYRRDVLKQDVHVFDPYGVTEEQSCFISLLDQLGDVRGADLSGLAGHLLQEEIEEAPSVQKAYDRRHPTEKQRFILDAVEDAQALAAATMAYVISADEKEIPEGLRDFSACADLLTSSRESWPALMDRFKNDQGSFRVVLNRAARLMSDATVTSSVNEAIHLAAGCFIQNIPLNKKTQKSSFALSDLRDRATTLYVVLPDYEALGFQKRWLRALIETAEDACPNVIDSIDDHTRLYQKDRILFMIDGINQLGGLSFMKNGAHSPMMKGISYWGLMPFREFGKNSRYIENDPHVQDLTRYNENGINCGCFEDEAMIGIVQKHIIANPPRPAVVRAARASDLSKRPR